MTETEHRPKEIADIAFNASREAQALKEQLDKIVVTATNNARKRQGTAGMAHMGVAQRMEEAITAAYSMIHTMRRARDEARREGRLSL